MNKYSIEKSKYDRKIYLLLKKHEVSTEEYEYIKSKKDCNVFQLEHRIKRAKEICEKRNIYKRNSPTFFKFLPNDLINDICKKNILKEAEDFLEDYSLLRKGGLGWPTTNEGDIFLEQEYRQQEYDDRRQKHIQQHYGVEIPTKAGKMVKRRYKAIAKAKENMKKLLDGITRIRMGKLISKQILDKQNKQDIMTKNYVYDCIITMRQEHQRKMIKWEIEEAEKHIYKYHGEHGHKWDYNWTGLPDNINRMKSLCEKLMKAEKEEKEYYLLELSRLVGARPQDTHRSHQFSIFAILKNLLDRVMYYEWRWKAPEEDKKAILDMLEELVDTDFTQFGETNYWDFVKDYFQLS